MRKVIYCSSIPASVMCDEYRSYLNDMSCAFKPCGLDRKKSRNSRLKQEHVHFSSPTIENTKFLLLFLAMATKVKVSKVVAKDKEFLAIKFKTL